VSESRVGGRRPPWLVVALATVVGLAVLVAVLTPRATPAGAPLASNGASPTGALGIYETLARLGWRPERRTTPLDRTPANVVYVAVRADHGVDASTAGPLLAAVRDGAGLVVDVRPGDALSDSLGLVLAADAGAVHTIDNAAAAAALGAGASLGRPGCRARNATDVASGTGYVSFTLADSGAAAATRAGRRVLLDVAVHDSAGDRREPVVLGFPYGRGRVVALADASVLTNAAVRACWAVAGVAAVRAFEWVSGDATPVARPRVVFFEGMSDPDRAPPQPSVLRAVRRALTEAPAGRAVLQVAAAALVLLAAAAVRALPPVPAPRAARRSPLEHVGALARAYREVRASRIAARRLASGLRRRYGGPTSARSRAGVPTAGAASTDPDALFLAGVAARHPARAADAARLTAALTTAVAPADVVAVGEAAERIARTLDAARRGAAGRGRDRLMSSRPIPTSTHG